jgi:hypothetical protein
VAGIGAYSVLAAARKQADAALQAAREQAKASQDLAILQVEAALASSGRQQWVSVVRSELSELVGELYVLRVLTGPDAKRDSEAALDHGKRFISLMAQINLLLKDDVPLHRDLMTLLSNYVASIDSGEPPDDSMINIILRLGQQIIRSEEAVIARITDRSKPVGGEQ